jgi:hypothetical protein
MKVINMFEHMNIDEFVDWLDKHGSIEDAPWFKWWDSLYCNNCEPVCSTSPNGYGESEYSFCELHGNCRYFQNMDDIPSGKQIIKMWLESEI